MTSLIPTDTGFFHWLMEILYGLCAIRTPFLDGVMGALSKLGEETFFIVIGLILFWCVDKKFGYRFLLLYCVGTFLNQFLKDLFLIPRPWMIDPDFPIVEAAREGASGWSFPSGHTQGVVLIFGSIARYLKKTWAYVCAAVLILLVAFSRMYLGVHTLLDVGVSLILGILLIILMEAVFARQSDDTRLYTIISALVAVLCLGLVVYALISASGHTDLGQVKDASVLFGTAFGLFSASVVERRTIRFDPHAGFLAQCVKVVWGLAIVLGLRIALKPLLGLLSPSPVMDGVRYFVISFIAIGVYPRSFAFLSRLGAKKD